jgi:ribonuclease P protein component
MDLAWAGLREDPPRAGFRKAMPNSTRDERFPRAARLRKRRQFLALQDRGRRVGGGKLFVLVTGVLGDRERSLPVRLGVTVSKKVGCAVVRSRVKRCVRETFRKFATEGAFEADWVVIARPAAADASLDACRQDLRQLFARVRGVRG